MSKRARFVGYSGNMGHIYDTTWKRPGYVLKVWAKDPRGQGLLDTGPAVEAQMNELLNLLNGAAALRALLDEVAGFINNEIGPGLPKHLQEKARAITARIEEQRGKP